MKTIHASTSAEIARAIAERNRKGNFLNLINYVDQVLGYGKSAKGDKPRTTVNN